MNDAERKMRQGLELGFDPTMILTQLLGQSIAAFAREHGFARADVSMCFRRHQGRIYDAIRDKVATALDVSRAAVDELIDSQEQHEA